MNRGGGDSGFRSQLTPTIVGVEKVGIAFERFGD
jgi:hypothetical protein